MMPRVKIFVLLITGLVSLPALSAPFQPYRKPINKPVAINIGIGTSHGGDSIAGITEVPVGCSSCNYYTEDNVNLGGEQSYFIGAILNLAATSEVWVSYGQMYDEAKPGASNSGNINDPNFNVRLDHDRLEAMYFYKLDRVRFGVGAVFDSDIKFKVRTSDVNLLFKFDNSRGLGFGFGLDMPFSDSGTALHFDVRYIRMNYTIQGEELNANSIGYFLCFSF